jgi:hypothetical protein
VKSKAKRAEAMIDVSRKDIARLLRFEAKPMLHLC